MLLVYHPNVPGNHKDIWRLDVDVTSEKKNRESVHIKLDPEVARLARIHRAETREPVNELVNRLLRKALTKQAPPPAA
jgi:hypothetical protein